MIRTCATHAHGAKMIAFLKAHRCDTTRRALATIFVRGDAINVTSIATSIAGSSQNPLGADAQFINLATSPGTGGINDLLQEGHHIPGPRGHMPPHPVFGVFSAGSGVNIIYAWYRDRPTPPDDPKLQHAEGDVKFSTLLS